MGGPRRWRFLFLEFTDTTSLIGLSFIVFFRSTRLLELPLLLVSFLVVVSCLVNLQWGALFTGSVLHWMRRTSSNISSFLRVWNDLQHPDFDSLDIPNLRVPSGQGIGLSLPCISRPLRGAGVRAG